MQIELPTGAQRIFSVLEQNGYRAYLVGGCVRDSLLETVPHDWDISTNAKPQEILRCFASARTVQTGIRHGTIGISASDGLYEITSFRCDGTYFDHRHPGEVHFVDSLEEDLSRRDFTVNAMAYHPNSGLIDPFGGRQDLENRIIRCVGDAKTRYTEDALRILRALRFASVLGFSLEDQTAVEAKECASLLSYVAFERIYEEFLKLLCGKDAGKILHGFTEVFSVFLPELSPMAGFCQHSPYHIYDVWEHTLRVVDGVSPQPVLRLAALFHDAGKPQCFTRDRTGQGHFFGHPEQGARLAGQVLKRLRADTETIRQVCMLIRAHEQNLLPEERCVRRALADMGTQRAFWRLLELQLADACAKAPEVKRAQERRMMQTAAVAQKVLEEGQCYSHSMLAVGGEDLKALGLEGKQIGKALSYLLDRVIDGTLPNKKDCLVPAAEKWRTASENDCLEKENMV